MIREHWDKALFLLLILGVAFGMAIAQESGLVNAPRISDKTIHPIPGEGIEIVTKDEHQRVSDLTTASIQRLENRVSALEAEMIDLRSIVDDGR